MTMSIIGLFANVLRDEIIGNDLKLLYSPDIIIAAGFTPVRQDEVFLPLSDDFTGKAEIIVTALRVDFLLVSDNSENSAVVNGCMKVHFKHNRVNKSVTFYGDFLNKTLHELGFIKKVPDDLRTQFR